MMTAQSRGSVKISGAGSAGGGCYDEVSISGSGAITGDVEAARLRASGSAKMMGDVNAGALRADGSLTIDGSADAGEFRSSGSTRVGGGVRADLLTSSGSLHVGGNVSGKVAEIAGAADVQGDVEVEELRCRGSATVGGLLSADRIEMVMYGDSRAKEIGGEQIRVLSAGRSSRFLRWLRGEAAMLQVDTVEGDDIYLERTRAAAVRGRCVVIGPGCAIAEVAYSESLHLDPEATAEHHTYTGPASSAPEPVSGLTARPKGWARDRGGGRSWFGLELGNKEARNPVLATLAALFGLIIAAAVIALVVFVVLPAVGLLVGIVLTAVAAFLVLLAIGLPLLILGSLLFNRTRRRR
jgi:cytoskeletal protein CcmA (bactofilin family)